MNGILLDSVTDSVVLRGSRPRMVLGDAREIAAQNARLILLSEKGTLKEEPTKGVAISRFVEDYTPERLMREVRREAYEEGLEIRKVQFRGGTIELDVEYKNR